MTPAAKLQDELKKRVKATGGVYRKVKWENRRGCPDCFVWWVWPQVAFIEVKAGKDRLSTLQGREVRRMQGAGVPVFTLRDEGEIDGIINKIRGCNV